MEQGQNRNGTGTKQEWNRARASLEPGTIYTVPVQLMSCGIQRNSNPLWVPSNSATVLTDLSLGLHMCDVVLHSGLGNILVYQDGQSLTLQKSELLLRRVGDSLALDQ